MSYTENDKHVDLSMYTFKSSNFIFFSHFCVSHNTNSFGVKFCMPVDYMIDYIQIFFQIFFEMFKYILLIY
jgi:hypothetical protein